MASILNVDQINNAAGTSALTIDTSGNVNIPGHVVQVVNSLLTGGVGNSSGTYADTGLTASITPTNSSNKILVLVNLTSLESNTASEGGNVKLVRDATDLSEWGRFMGYTRVYMTNHPSISYLDSPATTSSTTYKVQFVRGTGSGTLNLNSNSATSSMTLMEIAQ